MRLGLDGHSDADVLTHAVMDALLGAAGLGDIGALFPDNDPQYLGIDSTILLRRVGEKIARAGYQVANIDVTMIAQQPRLAPYLPAMEVDPRPGTWPWTGSRSISKRRRRSTWASPAWARAWPATPSACWASRPA